MAASTLLLACASTRFQDRPQPGYQCHLEKRGEFGLISTEFEVHQSGELRGAYLRWDASSGSFANPWITAAWYQRLDGRFDIENGYVSIMRHIWDPRGRPLELSLHLRTVAEVPPLSQSLIDSKFQRSGGPFHFRKDWTEISALARGAAELHLIALDKDHRVVDDVLIDRTIFERVAPHVEAALHDVEAMIADPASSCFFVNDLRANEIIVT